MHDLDISHSIYYNVYTCVYVIYIILKKSYKSLFFQKYKNIQNFYHAIKYNCDVYFTFVLSYNSDLFSVYAH